MPKFRLILNGNLIFKFFINNNNFEFFFIEKIKLRFFRFQYFKKFVKITDLRLNFDIPKLRKNLIAVTFYLNRKV